MRGINNLVLSVPGNSRNRKQSRAGAQGALSTYVIEQAQQEIRTCNAVVLVTYIKLYLTVVEMKVNLPMAVEIPAWKLGTF